RTPYGSPQRCATRCRSGNSGRVAGVEAFGRNTPMPLASWAAAAAAVLIAFAPAADAKAKAQPLRVKVQRLEKEVRSLRDAVAAMKTEHARLVEALRALHSDPRAVPLSEGPP